MNENNEYYWLGYYELGKGSIVHHGNWGRIKKKSLVNNLNITKELIYENIRLRIYPSYPSRLTSIFLCPSFHEIEKYQKTTGKITEVIHKVKVLEPDKNKIITDWNKFNLLPNDSLEIAEQRAKDYWSGENVMNPEILIESAIEIMDIHK